MVGWRSFKGDRFYTCNLRLGKDSLQYRPGRLLGVITDTNLTINCIERKDSRSLVTQADRGFKCCTRSGLHVSSYGHANTNLDTANAAFPGEMLALIPKEASASVLSLNPRTVCLI